jgi:hypothetical protein
MNEQTNWYRICIFCDDRHRGDLPREETRITKVYAWRTSSMQKSKLLFQSIGQSRSTQRNHVRFGSETDMPLRLRQCPTAY